MEELKKKEPYVYLQAADASQSNSYASPIPSDATNKMQHIPPLPAASTSYTKEPVTVNDEKVVPINFLKGSSVQNGTLLIGERSTQENDLLDSKHKRHSTRMFDLLLPADVYIDCEDAEKSDKEIVDESSSVSMFPLNSTRAADHEDDVKLSMGTSEGLNYGEDSCKSDSCTQNGVAARSLDDLNEPVEENFSDRAGGSVTYNFFSAEHNDLLHAEKKETIQERPFFSNEAGKNTSTVDLFSTGSYKEDFSMSSEAPQRKFKKPVEILSPKNQNKRGMSVREKQGQGAEISGRTPCEQNGSSRGPLAGQSSPVDNSLLPSQLNLPQIVVFGKQKLSSRVDGDTERRRGPTSSSGLRRTSASISMELDFSRGYPQLKKPSCCEISLQDISSISRERRRKSEARLSASRGGEQPATGSAKCSRKDEKKVASSKTRKSSSRGLREMVGSEAPIGIASRPDDAVAREAAENILWMLSSKERSRLDPFDTLHWFAEVVISADAASPDDGSDLFEQMTLELEETKPEDYFRKPWKVEDQNDGGGGDRNSNAASLLLAKPRRGRGKKRRQRRDFQRDILPGLASLSRREVTEDIQAFAALMRASGQSWQSGVTKRRSRGRILGRYPDSSLEAQIEVEGGRNVGRGA